MEVFTSVDTIWVLLGAVLVFFMQAGFAMVETGLTRAKNAGNIIMKNLMDFSVGTVAYWFVGFGIMFGTGTGFIGTLDFFSNGTYDMGVPTNAFIIFQTVFCATGATIVSGAMAERTKFSSYLIYSIFISLVVYPISGHWIWGGGWLSQLGFHDFAGSTAVHMLGGVAALVGAKMLGPRIGKFDENGKPRAILGHNLTLAALGVFILWFAWFGFNGCSTLGFSGDEINELASKIFMTTNIAAACASITVMIITWIRYKKPDVSMTLNGALAGLVAITAGCDAVSRGGAAIIGIIAAFVVVFGIEFIEKVLKIDDPVGAIGVHGLCGATGTILVGFLADGSDSDPGLFYGGSASVLGVQVLGVVAVAAWVAITMGILFTIIDKTNGLRVSREEEILGLDSTEHNLAAAYADFQSVGEIGTASESAPATETPVYDHREPNEYKSTDGVKLSKIVILTSQSTFDGLKHALDNIGITGMTVTKVEGCGVQRGMGNYYRGAKVDTTLLPKVKVEVVVSRVPVSLVVDTVKKALASDKIGAGKIFIYDVENVIRVRTGEEGDAALQDK